MSFTIPADDNALSRVASGNWTFAVAAFDGGTGSPVASAPQVVVKVRTDPGAPTVPSGYVPLNLFFVPNGIYNATTAKIPGGEIQGALTEANNLYSSQGISLDIANAQYYDLTGVASTIGTKAQLEQLFQSSASFPIHGVNIYFVAGFSGPDFTAGVAGIAGGIPIPMDFRGTQHSGIAVAPQGGTGLLTGDDIAHEMGHSLGLYHTTEFNPSVNGYDPISDTARCTNLGPNGENAAACPDRHNVMFPQLNGSFTGFSAGQATVIKPAVNVKTIGTFAPMGARPPSFEGARWPMGPIAAPPASEPGFVVTCTMRAPRIGPFGNAQP
jgi:hypothetical protein